MLLLARTEQKGIGQTAPTHLPELLFSTAQGRLPSSFCRRPIAAAAAVSSTASPPPLLLHHLHILLLLHESSSPRVVLLGLSLVINFSQYPPPNTTERVVLLGSIRWSDRCSYSQRWNKTYMRFHMPNPKQTYHLSMEYLQGHALTNTIGNLGITSAYAEAVKKFGYELEALAGQEKNVALGNGGLSRLASCFLDSMATLNLPAWGYGLRYRHGLFKHHISQEGQQEIAEDWLDRLRSSAHGRLSSMTLCTQSVFFATLRFCQMDSKIVLTGAKVRDETYTAFENM